MKALMWNGPRQMDLVRLDVPEPARGEALIKVAVVGICGSDLEGYLGHNSLRKPPLLMGHEFSGTIVSIGRDVKGWSVGDRVVANPLIACGTCPRCVRGRPNLCDRRQIVGIHRPGAYAEYTTVPVSCLQKFPDSLSFEDAALTEPLACALRAVRRSIADFPLVQMLVIGAGPIGILSALTAQVLGAAKVWIMDKNERRLQTAARLQLSGAFSSGDSDVAEQVRLAAGSRGVDVVLDAAGFQPTRELAIRLLNPGGIFMNIGLGIDDTVLPINHAIRSEIEIRGSFCYSPQDFSDALCLLESGKIGSEQWSTVRTLEDGIASFEELVSGQTSIGKILLSMD
ncbi:zinc-dependent alcohol dehydrogenase [Cohnella phaseoli]|uniref:Threonine dehydrogenase-like Zn-dependent dehydrogenase n=1 Tax=Cohnella phaseoli TaxID=456490 RepID=A0A3D9JMG4_9BACL|nr:galactitol-1-phosphate 5-dehydrogenase [Cohnella phaseoli]RED75144.1 threonine dehydrogenase-like Zn-dependent dehydrogenase [Cohnella phaseoli]